MIPTRLPWRHRARPSATLHEIQVWPEGQNCDGNVTAAGRACQAAKVIGLEEKALRANHNKLWFWEECWKTLHLVFNGVKSCNWRVFNILINGENLL
jgi:hypothetical protein